jgi:crotonobetainyl-CoA:carnitine CoA-transferase CaiB-like acyl-CoA transferase
MRPLQGFRVVELGLWVAAPACGAILAEWGAEVIKVESPEGDPNRHLMAQLGFDADTSAFDLDNRGKLSVVIDLKTADGAEQINELLASADVFLTNLRPSALERLSLDPEALRERFPHLVIAPITSYGWRGPDRDKPGYDVGAFWARTGIAATINAPDEAPPAIRPGLGDRVTALSHAAGILAALLGRQASGKGEVVDTSLLRSGIYCQGNDLSVQLALGKRARTRKREEHDSPLYNSYRSADGRWFWLIALEAGRHLPGIAAAIGRRDLIDDERFATGRARRRHCSDLIAILDEAFAARPLQEWAAIFDEYDVWWAPVRSLAEVVEDEQAEAIGSWVDVERPDGSRARAVATPVSFWSERAHAMRGAPALGEHTSMIMTALAPVPDGPTGPRGADAGAPRAH